ncbi:hypothetical protein A2Z67_05915 [Candidatus Woesebacteria bacterium RBG_13_36_22]|uniref:Thiopeptide-type bacteriocin biosynthesis domain-containing protein n=1 Tax=Candidatus Woesebacteria bacterium RBG_13_36_22 TaxID=1802478 RepID=A0A1F7X499_9BACT|nr:MAG: hypothetical protein A2Z67_05915 [Candidatus Woesebacteria bacterium RBG_13_36_22]
MNNRIDIPNWYQLDFDLGTPKSTLGHILEIMDNLERKRLIDKWFYLFEGKNIRVRMHSHDYKNLEKRMKAFTTNAGLNISSQHPFEGYWESTNTFEDIEVAEAFANVMSSLTVLTIKRIKGKQFSNYRLVERLSHCIFNNVYGLPTEEYFLLKRLLERYGRSLSNLNDNPEQTALNDTSKVNTIQNVSIKIPTLKVPIK